MFEVNLLTATARTWTRGLSVGKRLAARGRGIGDRVIAQINTSSDRVRNFVLLTVHPGMVHVNNQPT